ncbi:hypothetical protein H2248_003992, partial [Termitomyces sp. 'cryptogamus']
MRNEIERLRRHVQNLEGHCTRHRMTDQETDTINGGNKVVITNGVVAESSSYPIDLTSDASDEGHKHPLTDLIGINQGNFHLADTLAMIQVRDSNSPSSTLGQEDGVDISQTDTGKETETAVRPPRVGISPSSCGIPMSPSHSGLPPIKSQRKRP